MSQPKDRTVAFTLILIPMSFLLAVLMLALFEGALRVVGIGSADASGASQLKYQQIYLPILSEGTRPDGINILRPADKRLPYQSILETKPDQSIRVFVFGGSATAGLGYSPNAAFPRYLERILKHAAPDRAIEVMNMGIVALASKQVKHLVADVCRNYQPDVIVIYSGNNEFLEIHAEKYAARHQSFLSRVGVRARNTNLFRTFDRLVRGRARAPSLADQDLSHEDLRLTQSRIIQDIEMTRPEVVAAIDRYAANLEAMVDAASEANIPIILMTVAANWKWRGREDLPENWLDTLIGVDGPATPARYAQAVAILDKRIAASSPTDRHEHLFARAVAKESLGRIDEARADYREAMNTDPHLRRAFDEMNDRVRLVALERDAVLLDTVKVLSRQAEQEIIGFGEFYDYVHFTPRGALLVAAALFDTIQASGHVVKGTIDGFATKAYVQAETDRLSALEVDDPNVGEWLGFGFDKSLIEDRDLWKYDLMVQDLDRRIELDPNDARAHAYRGNAFFFQIDGAAKAANHYRTALAIDEDLPKIRRSLDLLRRDRDLETGL